MTTRTVRLLLAALVISMIAGRAGVSADARSDQQPAAAADAQAVKALFLYNFAVFVTWPAGGAADRPFTLAVVGDDDMVRELEKVGKQKKVHGRAFVPRSLAAGEDPDTYDMIFLPEQANRESASILRRTRGPVLTVGETAWFLADGGMIRLVTERNRLRFQINTAAVEKAGLHVGAQVMSLASRP